MLKEYRNNHNLAGRGDPERIRWFYLHYSILFLLLTGGMFFAFSLTGRSMVWRIDGKGQYFPQMVYLGRYVRELVSNLFHGNWDLRFYDFTIGMGEGILVAARIHRFDALSALFPVDLVGIFYTFLAVLRLYLAGVAFSAFCRFRQMDDRAVLTGTIVYLSCGFAVYRVPNHPFFASAMIMLPMMLRGVEKIIQGRRGTFFIIATALSFLSTYYFAYMCSIAVGVYFLLRWMQAGIKRTVSGKEPGTGSRIVVCRFFRQGFHIIGGWFIGIGMVSFILIPLFMHLFSSNRVKTQSIAEVPVLYPQKYVGNLLTGFISPNVEAGYNTRLNFIALVIPVLIILFFDRLPALMSLRIAIVIEVAGILIPAVGFVMGAFGNISNRWTFMMAFTLAYASVHIIQQGPVYGKKACTGIGVITVLYVLGTICFLVFGEWMGISSDYRLNTAVGCVCLVMTSAAVLIMRWRKVPYAFHCRVMLVISFVSAVVMGTMTHLPVFGNVVSEYMRWEDLPGFYEKQPDVILKEIHDTSFYRVDNGYYSNTRLNNSLYHDYFGIAEFNSVMNAGLQRFLLELENPGLYCSVKIMSMDGRAVCENLASVRYYLSESDSRIIPYGFEKAADTADGKNTLYKNVIPLHFAYTYDSVLPSSEYEKLSAAKKQQILMRAAVLDDEDLSSLPKAFLLKMAPATSEISIPIHSDQVLTNSQAKVCADGFELKKGGRLTFSCNPKSGYECYVRLSGISYEDANKPKDEEDLSVTSSMGTKKLNLRDSSNEYYIPMDSRMLYMGYYSQDTTEEIEVKLNAKGMCRIASIEMILLPMDSYKESVRNRNKGGCSDPLVSLNRIEGDLEDGGSRFVVLPVLYSKGWRAEVDAESVKLMQVNRCYSGFYVPKGAHHFKLTYSPPHWSLAVILTVFSWIIFIMTLGLPLVCRKTDKGEFIE